ncbi:monooxygenase [Secundilactobacillus oryzae JCM 18671]|uniref:Monooxygenase n=1 Tax=Secundilactobacillus oryzae JCM 18671 TaxID=1291743 RepID=A0A081BGJ7_9LACO|nr:hypothetical protein [Secundilactobacillus oryzae]GAK47165.1 monooxygenase [Secundilactobacillus oryzae JCM 18671]
MLKQVSITFGSYDILSRLQAQYRDRQLRLVQANNATDSLALVDLSGQDNVFKSGAVYDVKSTAGSAEHTGEVLAFIYIKNLSPDDQKVFNATANEITSSPNLPQELESLYFMKEQKNRGNNVIFSIWDSLSGFNDWLRSPQFARIKGFDTALHDFRTITYSQYHQSDQSN